MFKVNNRNTRHCSGVFIVHFRYIWHIILVFFCLSVYCFNLNSLMHPRVRFRSLFIFSTDLHVTTVKNNFQSLIFFCHEQLHLRCCKGLELNIRTWSTKILKGIGGTPYLRIECNLGKIWKTHHPRCP